MDRGNSQVSAIGRTLVAVFLVFALLQATRMAYAMSWLTKPVVMVVVVLLGGRASNEGMDLVIGDLRVPWSRDCAGFDVLLVLWGVILWTCRAEMLSRRFWLRMVIAVPAALLANVARVLTIIAWRSAFYPAVESPQMHYFMGFIWLLPLLVFFIPRGEKSLSSWIMGMSLPAAALSLVAPQAGAPGGVWVTASALFLLAIHRQHSLDCRWERIVALLWIGAGIFIAGSGMESLWLPWLLTCPWCLPRDWWLRSALVLLPGTVPLFVMKFPLLVLPCLLWAAFVLWRASRSGAPVAFREPGPAAAILLGVLILLPFIASTIGPAMHRSDVPPPGPMARQIEAGSWEVRFLGQSPDIVITWHAPTGGGRHHTLPVCLSYRGVKLLEEPSHPGVFKDDTYWYAEVFLMPDGSLYDYAGYLRRTLAPFTHPGVQIMAMSRRERLDVAEFHADAQALFARLANDETRRIEP